MRLIICDPGLIDTHGHHYDYGVALARAAATSKVDVAFLTNVKFTDPIGGVCPPQTAKSPAPK